MTTENLPKITIAIISCNRLHYLKATVESARKCINYPNLEWIIDDDASTEPGLREYVESLDWVDHKLFRKRTHADAMNTMVDMANGEAILLWTDDIQFVVEGDWMLDIAEILFNTENVGSIGLECLRRPTYGRFFHPSIWCDAKGVWSELRRTSTRFRLSRRIQSTRNYPMRTFGWRYPGIIPSGVASLTRTKTWKTLGPWKTSSNPMGNSIKDSSLGAEDDMRYRYSQSRMMFQRAIPIVPVAASIVTDPTGSCAKVRGDKRYGVYMPPPDGTFYYHIYQQEDLAFEQTRRIPLAIEDYILPLGFQMPLDKNGILLKNSINLDVVSEIPQAQPHAS